MSTAIAKRSANGDVLVPSDPITLGNILAQSGFFSDSRDAAQAAVKVMAGQELGFGPVASMTGIYIVKGRVTVSSNLMAAAIKRSAKYDYRVTTHTDAECSIDFIQEGELIGTSSYTMEQAKGAGLANSDTYKKHPKNMLFARALSNGAKWYCPDIFGGPIYTPDELGQAIDGETGEVIDYQPPPAQEPAPAPALTKMSDDQYRLIVELIPQVEDAVPQLSVFLSCEPTRQGVHDAIKELSHQRAAKTIDYLRNKVVAG